MQNRKVHNAIYSGGLGVVQHSYNINSPFDGGFGILKLSQNIIFVHSELKY